MTYFKAIRPNGTDFRTGTVQWAPRSGLAQSGSVVRHPWSRYVGPYADSYLSVSTVATDCTGMDWPCRLLEVEPVDESGHVIEPVSPDPRHLPNKRAAVAWRIVRELDPMLALGPQAEQIVAFVERAGRLTDAEVIDLKEQHAASSSGTAEAWVASWHAADVKGRKSAWDAIRVDDPGSILARAAIRNAARALLVRDLIGQYCFRQADYNLLTGPWRRVIGPVYPDDND